MATSAAGKKLASLYGKLGEKERVRMLAKLSREHDMAEMEKLRRATPPEHADAYNNALKLLRVLNGNLTDWLAIFQASMERDRFRFQAFAREAALMAHLRYQLIEMWRFIKYPVTESEYNTIRRMKRSELLSLDGYAETLAEMEGDEPGLHPVIAEYLNSLPEDVERERRDFEAAPVTDDELQEDIRRADTIEKGIRAIMDDAIEKGELPKPKRKAGELVLPWGVLEDWAEGTTEETFDILGPASGEHVPMLRMFQAIFGPDWDIHPDSEADFVKEERRQMLHRLPLLPTIPYSVRDEIGTLDPPLTEKERERDWKRFKKLSEEWLSPEPLAKMMLDAAQVHADSRYQLVGVREAIATIQREDFYGEDPLWPETHAQLTEVREEADRFAPLWVQANSVDWSIKEALYKLQGLEPPRIGPGTPRPELQNPAPLPEKEPNTETVLQLIRGWAE